MTYNTNVINLLIKFFTESNEPKIPYINTSVFMKPDTIEEILSAIKEDILKTNVTDIINVCGVDLDFTNKTLTKLIKAYRMENTKCIIDNLITIDYDTMNSDILNKLCNSKIVRNFEIPYCRNGSNQIVSTIFIKIYDQLSVNQSNVPVISLKINDIMVIESDSNYYPLTTSLSFNKTFAGEKHNHKMYNIKINYQDNNGNEQKIPVNIDLSDLSFIEFTSQMQINAPAFLNLDDSIVDNRITSRNINVNDLDNISCKCSGGLWEITDGIPWKKWDNKEIKSNKIIFAWKKYYEIIDKY